MKIIDNCGRMSSLQLVCRSISTCRKHFSVPKCCCQSVCCLITYFLVRIPHEHSKRFRCEIMFEKKQIFSSTLNCVHTCTDFAKWGQVTLARVPQERMGKSIAWWWTWLLLFVYWYHKGQITWSTWYLKFINLNITKYSEMSRKYWHCTGNYSWIYSASAGPMDFRLTEDF